MNKNLIGAALATLMALVLFVAGCGGGHHRKNSSDDDGVAPTLSSTAPANGETAAPTSRRITATFSEPMDAASLTPATFSAVTPSGPLTGTVEFVDRTATLMLATPMPANTQVTATITAAAKDVSGVPLAADYVWTFTTGAAADTVAPTVSSTDPDNDAIGVVTNKTVSAIMSEPMAADTINATTFTLSTPAGPIAGKVSILNNVVSFEPSTALPASTVVTATITTGATDLSDNPLAVDKVWTFTTGVSTDTTAPTISAVDPLESEMGISVNKKISVTFSEPMDVATITATTFNLRNPAGDLIPGTIGFANNVAILEPTAPLVANTVYSVKVTTGVKDSAGNALVAEKTWNFTTAVGGDTVPPTVSSTNPVDTGTNAFLNQSINATFSEAMNATTLTTATFVVDGVPGTVTYDTVSRIANFKPTSDLQPNTTYTAHIETGAQDSAGNGLAVSKIWTFTTGVQRSQLSINLGAATTYAVLAGSTVTSGGPTIVNGDLGVSPGTSVTGFPPGIVNGSIHAGDSTAAQAKQDLLAGQLDAAGRLGGAPLPGDLAGLTFTPGLYENTSSVMLSSGAVTLDALGDPDAVFIFQMATTLTTSAGTQVILTGGAKASNVYWSVGSSATLGVNSIFKGIILAEVSITVNNGATNDGTLLTKVGAVTLQANTVSRSIRRGK